MVRAAIYDLDGTLVDSRGDLADSVNAMLGTLGLPPRPDETIWTFIGEGADRLVRRSLGPQEEHRFPEALETWRAQYARRLLIKTRPYPGVAGLLRSAPDARGVLTNKPGGFAREILQGLGMLGAFRAVVGGDEAPRKPAPEGLLALCEALGAAPREALLVGDSTVDVATARAAGVRICAVTWGLGARAELQAAAPDYLCDTPEEVAGVLARLQPRA
jgi:phosphoglycolate phosphatase